LTLLYVRMMGHFGRREWTAILISSLLWAIVDLMVAQTSWSLTYLTFFSDITCIYFLILSIWLSRKPVAPTLVGLVATIFVLKLRPEYLYFIGYTASSVAFDALTWAVGYQRCLGKGWVNSIILIAISVSISLVVGVTIDSLLITNKSIHMTFGQVTFFTALHCIGGLIGGLLGVTTIRTLVAYSIEF
jgi:hypothetical protein